MLLNAEELLALVNGDAEPDRLADLLDRLENCPDSAAALQVLVALRANRAEGLEALKEAAEAEPKQLIQHPLWRTPTEPSTRWGIQPLRLAASIAIVGILGILVAASFLGGTSVTSLATLEFEDSTLRPEPIPVEPTGNAGPSFEAVSVAISEERYADSRSLLSRISTDPSRVAMYLGMTEYFAEDYDAALEQFAQVAQVGQVGDDFEDILHQTHWYEANTLLALNRPMDALIALERMVSSARGWPYHEQAAAAYDDLCGALGINSSAG